MITGTIAVIKIFLKKHLPSIFCFYENTNLAIQHHVPWNLLNFHVWKARMGFIIAQVEMLLL